MFDCQNKSFFDSLFSLHPPNINWQFSGTPCMYNSCEYNQHRWQVNREKKELWKHASIMWPTYHMYCNKTLLSPPPDQVVDQLHWHKTRNGHSGEGRTNKLKHNTWVTRSQISNEQFNMQFYYCSNCISSFLSTPSILVLISVNLGFIMCYVLVKTTFHTVNEKQDSLKTISYRRYYRKTSDSFHFDRNLHMSEIHRKNFQLEIGGENLLVELNVHLEGMLSFWK